MDGDLAEVRRQNILNLLECRKRVYGVRSVVQLDGFDVLPIHPVRAASSGTSTFWLVQ